MSLSRKSRLTGVLLSGLLLTTGCYGPFNWTQQVWHWNGKATDNKWANEGIFLVCWIIPIYEFSALADVFIFNVWNFWTDKNLVDAPGVVKIDEHRDMTLSRVSDSQVKVEYFEDGTLTRSFTVDQANGVNSVLRDANGVELAAAQAQADGQIELLAPR